MSDAANPLDLQQEITQLKEQLATQKSFHQKQLHSKG